MEGSRTLMCMALALPTSVFQGGSLPGKTCGNIKNVPGRARTVQQRPLAKDFWTGPLLTSVLVDH